jgi:hypothetical protein
MGYLSFLEQSFQPLILGLVFTLTPFISYDLQAPSAFAGLLQSSRAN